MRKRLTKIYTRTGDDGTTGLGTGTRVPKESLRVEAYGTVDELNSAIGTLLACGNIPERVNECLSGVQQRLFDLGGELCIPGSGAIAAAEVAELEKALDTFNAELPALENFVLPGGTPAAAACHLARTVCRRAERRAWSLARTENLNENSLQYLNRLSDLLFVIARYLNRNANRPETLWQPGSGGER
jgi:cob(I)alamin adenosyltransferase